MGETFAYKLKFTDPGAFWYHPHVRTDYALESGLYANIIVTPKDSAYWSPVNREVPLMLDDIALDEHILKRLAFLARDLLDLIQHNIGCGTGHNGVADANIEAGKVRPLAVVAGKGRAKAMPDVPTLAEQGYDLDFRNWVAIFLPRGAPMELARRWKPEIYSGFKKASKHEALADIYESIDELKYYREHFIVK